MLLLKMMMLRSIPSDGGGAGDGNGGAPVGGDSGAGTTVSTDTGTTTISVPSAGGGSSETPPADTSFADSIPAEYREKPYIQNLLKSADPKTEVWKQFDGLQTKIGERAPAVPAADAPDADWEKFYEQTRPKDKAEYVVPEFKADGKEELAKAINESSKGEYADKMREAAYKYGLTSKQFQGLAAANNEFAATAREKAQQEAAEAINASETGFDEEAKKTFGGDKEKALERGKAAINEMFTPEQKDYFGGLDNKALIALALLANKYHAKYETEDSLAGSGAPANAVKTEAELREEMSELLSTPAARNKFDPAHDAFIEKRNALANRIAEAQKRGTK